MKLRSNERNMIDRAKSKKKYFDQLAWRCEYLAGSLALPEIPSRTKFHSYILDTHTHTHTHGATAEPQLGGMDGDVCQLYTSDKNPVVDVV